MKALAGIRVIDFSKWLPGQYCGMVLGDFGADVIKVETPAGDATRGFFPAALPGMSYWHLALNRNKRGITADIRTEGGRKLLLALLARERTGEGQSVDVNLYNTSLSLQTTGISSLWGCKATGCQPFGRTAHYYNIYRTQDGRYLSVGTIEPKFWRRLCGLLGCADLIDRQYDFEHGGELQERLAAVFQTKTQADWLALIGAEEFCVTPVCSLEEALNSELTQQSAMLTQRQEDIGMLQYVQPAIRLSEMPGSIERRAPLLGEHTAEVLAELGYSEAEIMRLQETGAI